MLRVSALPCTPPLQRCNSQRQVAPLLVASGAGMEASGLASATIAGLVSTQSGVLALSAKGLPRIRSSDSWRVPIAAPLLAENGSQLARDGAMDGTGPRGESPGGGPLRPAAARSTAWRKGSNNPKA